MQKNINKVMLINEEIYENKFDEIKSGDLISVITKYDNFNFKVLDKTMGQLAIHGEGENYILFKSSLNGNKIKALRVKDKKNIIVNDVKVIKVYRNGELQFDLIPETSDYKSKLDLDSEQDKINSEKQKENEGLYSKELIHFKNILKTVEEDSKLIIDSDGGSIEIHISDLLKDGLVKGSTTKIEGDKYLELDESYILFSKDKSLGINHNGIFLKIRLSKNNNDFLIENIIDLTVSEYFNDNEPTFDDLMQNKNFRDLMLKQPSLMGQIMGQMSKGVLPASEIIKKLGLSNSYFSKGRKVRFKYIGKNIETNTILKLRSSGEYIGIFSDSKTIRLSGNRGESLLIKLIKKGEKEEYQVKVDFRKIKNGKAEISPMGEGIIQIIDSNYK
jgi:hypothetical protein